MVGLDMPDDHPARADGTSRPNYGDAVIRRSFRFGLALGLLGGLAAALAKVLGSRPDQLTPAAAPAVPEPWPPLVVESEQPAPMPGRPPTPVVEPTAAEPAAVADPDVAAPEVDPVVPELPAAPARGPAPSKPRKAPLKAAPAPAARTAPAKKVAKKVAKTAAPRPAPKPATAAQEAAPARWVEPVGDVCPTTHPVKAKMASLIFHVPGGLSYARTRPDRCYVDPAAAESDGLRPAKR